MSAVTNQKPSFPELSNASTFHIFSYLEKTEYKTLNTVFHFFHIVLNAYYNDFYILKPNAERHFGHLVAATKSPMKTYQQTLAQLVLIQTNYDKIVAGLGGTVGYSGDKMYPVGLPPNVKIPSMPHHTVISTDPFSFPSEKTQRAAWRLKLMESQEHMHPQTVLQPQAIPPPPSPPANCVKHSPPVDTDSFLHCDSDEDWLGEPKPLPPIDAEGNFLPTKYGSTDEDPSMRSKHKDPELSDTFDDLSTSFHRRCAFKPDDSGSDTIAQEADPTRERTPRAAPLSINNRHRHRRGKNRNPKPTFPKPVSPYQQFSEDPTPSFRKIGFEGPLPTLSYNDEKKERE